MGRYVNPPESIKEIGRTLLHPPENKAWENLRAQLKPGEELYGMYDRGIYKLTVQLNPQSEFEGFEDQYRKGLLLSRTFYAATPASVGH